MEILHETYIKPDITARPLVKSAVLSERTEGYQHPVLFRLTVSFSLPFFIVVFFSFLSLCFFFSFWDAGIPFIIIYS